MRTMAAVVLKQPDDWEIVEQAMRDGRNIRVVVRFGWCVVESKDLDFIE
jgi:hypothetical protein